MTRETLKHYIDNILIEKCGLEKNFFSTKSNDGESLVMKKELLHDAIDWYEVLSTIEYKCKILVNDEMLLNDNMTYGEFIDVFYSEIEREKNGLA